MFRIYSRINNFYVYSCYCNRGHDGSLYECLLDSMARVQAVDDNKSLSLLMISMLITLSGWKHHASERRDALHFCNLSGCEQLVRCPTHIAGNRLDLVMTDVHSRGGCWYSTRHFRNPGLSVCPSC